MYWAVLLCCTILYSVVLFSQLLRSLHVAIQKINKITLTTDFCKLNSVPLLQCGCKILNKTSYHSYCYAQGKRPCWTTALCCLRVQLYQVFQKSLSATMSYLFVLLKLLCVATLEYWEQLGWIRPLERETAFWSSHNNNSWLQYIPWEPQWPKTLD